MRAAAVLLLAVTAAAPAPLPAGPEGVFALDRAASDDVKQAIDRSAGEFNFLLRPFARSRLTKANPVPQRIEIAYTGSEVRVQLDRVPAVSAPRDGRTVKWKRDDGALFDLTARIREGTLEQSFRGDDGERINVYRLEPDGKTLKMGVTLKSPRLPKPLTYTLVFRRAAA